MNKLKKVKAPDTFGLSAEHLKYGGQPTLSRLTCILNQILQSRSVPQEGVITPVINKGDKQLPGNHKNHCKTCDTQGTRACSQHQI